VNRLAPVSRLRGRAKSRMKSGALEVPTTLKVVLERVRTASWHVAYRRYTLPVVQVS